MMRDAWIIAKREFLERVRNKWFLIGTLLGPLAMVALIVIPAVLANADDAVRIRIVDRSARFGPALTTQLTAAGWAPTLVAAETPEAELKAALRAEAIDGYLWIPEDALTGGAIVYQGDNAANVGFSARLQATIYATALRVRAGDAGLSDLQLLGLFAPINIEARYSTGDDQATSGTAALVVGYAVMFIMYMALMLYGSAVMRSVVQEKTSRVVELLVAAAKPRALMAGKILGVGGVGLVQVGVWVGMAALTLQFRGQLLGAFGAASGGFAVPPLALSEITVVIVYFLLGYFFYASLFAAVGAMVSSEQEAQQAQLPVVLLLIIPTASMQIVAGDPRGGTAELLTQLPFASPILMPMRHLLGGASPAALAMSIGILALSTVLASIAAGRIYRTGILMVGKRPSLRELWRWLRV